MELSSDTLIGFAKMLASNSTLELVELFEVRPAKKDQVSPLFEKELYASAFKRLRFLWPEQLLPQLTSLLREQAWNPELSVSVTSSVDEAILREFFDAVRSGAQFLQRISFFGVSAAVVKPGDEVGNLLVQANVSLRELFNLEDSLIPSSESLETSRPVKV
ncbi:hypothetical protein HPB49_024767 [Dermacentor silvarum]|uniref:Uncharacterized protein n=1 Tax=Dermacentor silvarum TaxID=543639 RepID=A0ACB8DS33_DERSI|nr:hypothetical protein HPB49_024767 [Dermacentor silvarum]